MSVNENDFFGTSDLSLAAALRASGGVVEVVDRNDPGRAVFHFRRSRGLDEVVQRFWAHEMRVDPLAYFGSLKELKALLYSAR